MILNVRRLIGDDDGWSRQQDLSTSGQLIWLGLDGVRWHRGCVHGWRQLVWLLALAHRCSVCFFSSSSSSSYYYLLLYYCKSLVFQCGWCLNELSQKDIQTHTHQFLHDLSTSDRIWSTQHENNIVVIGVNICTLIITWQTNDIKHSWRSEGLTISMKM
jgi:hypothetical protein